MKNNFFTKFASVFLIVTLVTLMAPVPSAFASSVSSFSNTLTREKASTAGDQDISFVTPTGVASGATIILTYDNGTSIAAGLTFADIDLLDNGTDVTLAAAPSGATWGVVRTSATVITFTNGTTPVTAGHTIRIKIGTNATNQSTGVNQITNGPAGTTTLALSGTFGDSGTLAMSIIADDQVVVTATVAPTITFTVDDNTIGFGTLSTSAATWANGAGTGSASDTAAHTMTIATNAVGGYAISYNGPTLTSGVNTINVASITNDADGTPGTEQFGVGYSTSGDATIAAAYDHNATAGNRDWAWVASTTTSVVSETVPTNTETISAFYLANISSLTESGAYTTTINYSATGTF